MVAFALGKAEYRWLTSFPYCIWCPLISPYKTILGYISRCHRGGFPFAERSCMSGRHLGKKGNGVSRIFRCELYKYARPIVQYYILPYSSGHIFV